MWPKDIKWKPRVVINTLFNEGVYNNYLIILLQAERLASLAPAVSMNHIHWWRKMVCVGGHHTFVSMQIQTQFLNLLDKHGSGRGGHYPHFKQV